MFAIIILAGSGTALLYVRVQLLSDIHLNRSEKKSAPSPATDG